MNDHNKSKNFDGRSNNSLIIDHIYQVAIDPERYETLLDLWDEKIAPYKQSNSLNSIGQNAIFRDQELEDHFERAGVVLEKLDDSSKATIFQSMVDAIAPSAAFICDENQKIVATNKSASTVFTIKENDTISDLPFETDYIGELKNTASALIGNNQANSSSLLRIISKEYGKTIVFRLMKLDALMGEKECILYVSNELAWPDTLSFTITEAFGLTESEVEIVKALVEGSSVKQISENRGRALQTVKTQLRSVLAKTETHTQAELIRVTLGLMDVVTATEKSESATPKTSETTKLVERPFITQNLPNGRRVDHIVIGKPSGRAIIYLPLDYGLTRLPATAEQFAEDNDLKIIVPIRPGFGHTSKATKKSNYTQTVVDDMIAIMNLNDVKSAPFIALSNDAYFAYELHRQHPDRINAILNCGVGLPTTSPEQYERMGKWHRFILANAKYAPVILPFLVKAGFSLANRIGKRGFLEAVYSESQADKDTFNNDEVLEAMILGSEVCLSDWHSAHESFATEVIIQQSDWSHLVKVCKIPIHIWYGDQDPQIPLETAKELQDAHPEIDFIMEQDAGQLLFFKAWRKVFDKTLEYL